MIHMGDIRWIGSGRGKTAATEACMAEAEAAASEAEEPAAWEAEEPAA